MSKDQDKVRLEITTQTAQSRSRGGLLKIIIIIALKIIIIIAIVAGVIYGLKKTRYQFIARNFGVVETGQIYRSGRLTPRMLRKVIAENNIRTILDLGAYHLDSQGEINEQAISDELGVTRVRFDLKGDGTGNPNYYVQALRMMQDESTYPLLVHCAAGAQRASGVVLLFRHIVQGVDIADAYPETFDYKHKPDEWQLLAYIAQYQHEIAKSLESGEQIPGFEPIEYPLVLSDTDTQ